MGGDWFDALIGTWRQQFNNLYRRMAATVEQLSEDDLHWRPNEQSNSIANLVLHIRGNIGQFLEHGIEGAPDVRDRDYEFNTRDRFSKEDLLRRLAEGFAAVDRIIGAQTPDSLFQRVTTLRWRDGQATRLELISSCLSHYAEHLGQMMYIAKMRRGEDYAYLSVPPPGGRQAEI